MSFNEKVVLITGAGSGIGAEAARNFAKLGALIVMVSRNEKRLNAVSDQIARDGFSKPLIIVADVTTDCERIISETILHFGRLDVLVNNAGILGMDTVIDFDANFFDRMMNVNLKAPIVLTHLAVPHLEKTRGSVVNVSSTATFIPLKNATSYCISKCTYDQFTKCAAIALADKGIRVNAVNPGPTRTNIFQAMGIDDINAEKFYDEHRNLVGRVGNADDMSAAIVYLASESFITGVTMVVDGGLCCIGLPRDTKAE